MHRFLHCVTKKDMYINNMISHSFCYGISGVHFISATLSLFPYAHPLPERFNQTAREQEHTLHTLGAAQLCVVIATLVAFADKFSLGADGNLSERERHSLLISMDTLVAAPLLCIIRLTTTINRATRGGHTRALLSAARITVFAIHASSARDEVQLASNAPFCVGDRGKVHYLLKALSCNCNLYLLGVQKLSVKQCWRSAIRAVN